MIYDATVEITCDQCGHTATLIPDFVYCDYSGKNGYFDTRDSSIERKLEQCDWVCKDGKQYCSEECADAARGKHEGAIKR